jgi:hypothetical protein
MRQYPCKVVGLAYHGRADYVAANVHEGDFLTLVREPNNSHDDRAVAVYHNRAKIGYIPAEKRWVYRSICEGDTHEVWATEHCFDDDGNLAALAIQIAILTDGEKDHPSQSASPQQVVENRGALGTVGRLAFVVAGLYMAATFLHTPEQRALNAPSRLPCSGLDQKSLADQSVLYKESGLIIGHRQGVSVISEKRWLLLSQAQKVSLGITEFCSQHSDSIGTILLRGDAKNTKLGAVVNGNWITE